MPPAVLELLILALFVLVIRVVPRRDVPVVFCTGDLPRDGFWLVLSWCEEEPLPFSVEAEVALPTVLAQVEVEEFDRPASLVLVIEPWREGLIVQGLDVGPALQWVVAVVEVAECEQAQLSQDEGRERLRASCTV